MRRLLDYASAELDELKMATESGVSNDLEESFVDYLNFFEFVASLWKMGQLSRREISMIFEYYIRVLRDSPFVMKYIHENGFENLAALIESLPQKTRA